jgi:hypothetical protein
MLGHDMAMLLDAGGRNRMAALLASQAGEEQPARLPQEMNPLDPERARRMLAEARRGLMESTE